MEPAQQAKYTQKNSANGSEQHKKRRPSLFPIRNSAKRKSSMCESKSIFDPHDNDCNSNRIRDKNAGSDQFDNRQSKSETQFEYRTPSGLSDYSSPRTSKSSPKDFIADTPFVPFVHQSLTKTVWESEQVIPQQKDDIDRKQSQTQISKNNDFCNQIKQHQQRQRQIYQPHHKQAQSNPDLNTINNHNHNDNANNHEVKIEPEQEQSSNFHTCIAVSIAIPADRQGQEEREGKEQRLDTCQVREEQSDGSKSPVVKEQTCGDETSVQYQVINEIEHNSYVSKAHIYQRKEQQKQAQHSDNFQSFNRCQLQNKPKFSFSYLDSISIRPAHKPIQSTYQQTSPKKLSLSSTLHIQKFSAEQKSTYCQSSNPKLQKCNESYQQIKSTKKESRQMQTSYKERLDIISKSYNEKVGFAKSYRVESQQTESVKKVHGGVQTQKVWKEQLNLSIHYDYMQHTENKLEQLQSYIRNIYEQKQAQIQSIKNRKSVDTSINTESVATPTPSKSLYKTVKDAFSQYETKDFGTNRPSLKRVSIAAAPIIYEISDSSNSTETFEQVQSKRSSKGKSRGRTNKQPKLKQGQKQQIMNVKLQNLRQQTESQYAPAEQQQQERRKSKRKTGKTPRKKSKH